MPSTSKPSNASQPRAGPDLVELYDECYYDAKLHRAHWFHNNRAKQELRWREVLRMVSPQSTDTLIDLGCAIGENTLRLAPLVARTIGVDFSATAISMVRRRRALTGARVEFHQTGVDDLSMVDAESIDKALAIDLIEHIDDRTLAAMQFEVWRVLRPGGTLSIYTPCGTHYVERLKARNWILRQIPGHIAVRTPEHCKRAFSVLPWQIRMRYFSPSTYPIFRWLDLALAPLPLVGPLFRYRYCIVLQKTAAA